ncbi:MAG TPA: hypothetical protein VI815_00285 [Candidatus Nanoarchaeia archaeon]|nr:hypothetical protein [Candidatus Nanoarchaeia archaeon]
MTSKQNIKLLEKYNDFHNKNNLICPRCISESFKEFVKTKKATNDFKKISSLSKEIEWIVNRNKFLENHSKNVECSVCGNKSVYIEHKFFIEALNEIIKSSGFEKSLANEFKSYFKKIS